VVQVDSLDLRLAALHRQLLEFVPEIWRITCFLHDQEADLLRPFLFSSLDQQDVVPDPFRLVDHPLLLALAENVRVHVLEERCQDCRSSLAVPMADWGEFVGFIFYDSHQSDLFSTAVQRRLSVYSDLISATISLELNLARSLRASASLACDCVGLRDRETGHHVERVALYSRLIAQGIAVSFGLTEEFVEHVFQFAPLHDIGKIGIPDRILLKPGRLSDEELVIMRSHVEKGVLLLNQIVGKKAFHRLPESRILRNIVAYHHERMDGSGYPAGLVGTAIPVEARIVAVADVLDALSGLRPYRKSWSISDSVRQLEREAACGKLDPHCVSAISGNLAEVEEIHARHQD
jgi:HD-GYP domain-containing protein (c-di-GMP phosphodiesterase class II)